MLSCADVQTVAPLSTAATDTAANLGHDASHSGCRIALRSCCTIWPLVCKQCLSESAYFFFLNLPRHLHVCEQRRNCTGNKIHTPPNPVHAHAAQCHPHQRERGGARDPAMHAELSDALRKAECPHAIAPSAVMCSCGAATHLADFGGRRRSRMRRRGRR